jgi:hypothetical protein
MTTITKNGPPSSLQYITICTLFETLFLLLVALSTSAPVALLGRGAVPQGGLRAEGAQRDAECLNRRQWVLEVQHKARGSALSKLQDRQVGCEREVKINTCRNQLRTKLTHRHLGVWAAAWSACCYLLYAPSEECCYYCSVRRLLHPSISPCWAATDWCRCCCCHRCCGDCSSGRSSSASRRASERARAVLDCWYYCW